MTRYILERLIWSVPVLLGVSLIVFLVLALAPGDAARALAGTDATESDIEHLRRPLGLDQPLPIQYLHFLGRLVRLDLGQSAVTRRPVTAEIMDNLLQTVGRTRARFAILDLTGVEVVDTGTASHLIGMIQAIRLLGAEGILTGIHPMIAQTIVALGVDLTRVAVFAKLRDALYYCIGQLGRKRTVAPSAAT